VAFSVAGCGVLELVLVFTLAFVFELPLTDAAVVAAEEPLFTVVPELLPLLPAVALLVLQLLLPPALPLPLLITAPAVPPLPHPLEFPPDW
jgi:hypothetical protein